MMVETMGAVEMVVVSEEFLDPSIPNSTDMASLITTIFFFCVHSV